MAAHPHHFALPGGRGAPHGGRGGPIPGRGRGGPALHGYVPPRGRGRGAGGRFRGHRGRGRGLGRGAHPHVPAPAAHVVPPLDGRGRGAIRVCRYGQLCGDLACARHHGVPWCRGGINCPYRRNGCNLRHPGRPIVQAQVGFVVDPEELNIVYSFNDAVHLDPINCRTEDMMKFCQSQNFQSQRISRPLNMHEQGAIIREMGCRIMLQVLVEQGHRVILAPFDFGRLRRIATRWNRLCNLERDPDKIAIEIVDLNIPHVVDDRCRAIRPGPALANFQANVGNCTAAIFNDQYYGLDAQSLGTYFGSLAVSDFGKMIVLSCFDFLGPMGVSAGCQPWIRRSQITDPIEEKHWDGLNVLADEVICYADGHQAAYVHPCLPHLYEFNYENAGPGLWVGYTQNATIAGRDIWKITPADVPFGGEQRRAQNLMAPWCRSISFVLTPADILDIIWDWQEFLPDCFTKYELSTQRFDVYNSIYAAVLADFGSKNHSERNVGLSRSEITKIARKTPDFIAFLDARPDEAEAILENTRNAAIYQARSRHTHAYRMMAKYTKRHISRARAIRDAHDWNHVPEKILLAGGVLLAAFCVYKLTSSRKDVASTSRPLVVCATGIAKSGLGLIQRIFGSLKSVVTRALCGLRTLFDVPKSFMDLTSSVEVRGCLAAVSIPLRRWCSFGHTFIKTHPKLTKFAIEALVIAPPMEFWLWHSCPLIAPRSQTTKFFISLFLHSVTELRFVSALEVMGVLFRMMTPSLVSIGPWEFHLLWNFMVVLQLAFKERSVINQRGFSPYVIILAILLFIFLMKNKQPSDFSRFEAEFNAHGEAQHIFGSSPIPLGVRLLTSSPHPTLHLTKVMDPFAKVTARFGSLDVSLESIPVDKRIRKITPIIATNGLLSVPSPGQHATLFACLNRNCVLTPVSTDPEAWREVGGQFTTFLEHNLEAVPKIPLSLREWADHYDRPHKRREAHAYVDTVEKGEAELWDPSDGSHAPHSLIRKISRRGNKMHAKSDESLKNKGGGVKPRTIQSVAMGIQVVTQPHVHMASTRLKLALADSFMINWHGVKRRFHFTYASGMNGEQISDWLSSALARTKNEGDVTSIFNGDDSLTMEVRNGELVFREIDYKHFDQSQKDIQNELELSTLKSLGVPVGVLDVLHQVSRNHAIGRKISDKIGYSIHFVPSSSNRVTGAPNTSLSNSTNNMIGVMIAAFHGFSQAGWDVVGFEAEMNTTQDLDSVSFLKGRFHVYRDGIRRWGARPSCMLKLGKTLSLISTQKCLTETARGTALGMNEVPPDYPILGDFREKMMSFSTVDKPIRDRHKPASHFSADLDVVQLRVWMCSHYGITDRDIDEAVELIRRIDSLPYFIGHPVFERFQIDY